MIIIIAVILAACVGGGVGFLVGQRHERLVGAERQALGRRYWQPDWKPDAGASSVAVSLGLIAVGAAYVAGHVLVWVLR
jgi:hypothetical protein